MPSPEVSAYLNREFYSGDPAQHLASRIHYLMLVAARGDEVDGLLTQGLKLGPLSLVGGEGDRPTPTERSAFVTAEAQTLLHHSAEAMLRLYLAHRTLPECPWVELAGLTNFRTFKERVSKLETGSWKEQDRARLVDVFLGNVEGTPEKFEEAKDALQQFIVTLARHYLNGSNSYNAIKHGFAIQAGRHRITVGIEQGDESSDQPRDDGKDLDSGLGFEATGETVTYLEHSRGDAARSWRLTTAMMNAEHALALAQLAVTEIEALWMVARHRYTGAPMPTQVPCINMENVATLRELDSERELLTFSRHVFDEPLGGSSGADPKG